MTISTQTIEVVNKILAVAEEDNAFLLLGMVAAYGSDDRRHPVRIVKNECELIEFIKDFRKLRSIQIIIPRDMYERIDSHTISEMLAARRDCWFNVTAESRITFDAIGHVHDNLVLTSRLFLSVHNGGLYGVKFIETSPGMLPVRKSLSVITIQEFVQLFEKQHEDTVIHDVSRFYMSQCSKHN
jgi:hypothetical protein